MKKVNLIYCFIFLFAFSCIDGPNMPIGIMNSNIPTILITDATDILHNGATLAGNVKSGNGYKIESKGFIYSTNSNPQGGTNVPVEIKDDGIGVFSKVINGLQSSTQYYYVAYAKNEKGIQYSDVISFKTNSVSPTIETSPIKNVNDGQATCGGIIISQGASPVLECGIYWSLTSTSPTDKDSVRLSSDMVGDFSSVFEKLVGNKTYYFRAFARNSYATSYGETMQLKTPLIWEPLNTFPGPGRIAPASFSLSHNFYVIAGDQGTSALNDTWEYSISSGNWLQKSTFPGNQRKAPTSFVIGNKGYVGLGSSSGGGNPLADFYYYIQSSNEWHNIEAPFAGTPRAYATGFGLNNKGYVVGGRIQVGFDRIAVSDIWQYSIDGNAGSWKKMTSFPVPLVEAISFVSGNRGFVGFGNKIPQPYNQIWEYDADNDSWSEFTTAPVNFYLDEGITGVGVVENIAYFIDGANFVWALDLNKKTWTRKTKMPVIQSTNQRMFADGHDLYIGLNQHSTIFYKYRPLWDN